ncbi:hypothetical protein DXG01_004097 [Tephrocybe rancida]|nr:hypothetical protein DXG01_004097 [Tephrocybe rancida]
MDMRVYRKMDSMDTSSSFRKFVYQLPPLKLSDSIPRLAFIIALTVYKVLQLDELSPTDNASRDIKLPWQSCSSLTSSLLDSGKDSWALS